MNYSSIKILMFIFVHVHLCIYVIVVESGFGGSLLLSEQAQTQRAQYNKFGREIGSRIGL